MRVQFSLPCARRPCPSGCRTPRASATTSRAWGRRRSPASGRWARLAVQRSGHRARQPAANRRGGRVLPLPLLGSNRWLCFVPLAGVAAQAAAACRAARKPGRPSARSPAPRPACRHCSHAVLLLRPPQTMKKQLAAHPLMIAFFFFVLVGSGVFTFFLHLPSNRRVLSCHASMPRRRLQLLPQQAAAARCGRAAGKRGRGCKESTALELRSCCPPRACTPAGLLAGGLQPRTRGIRRAPAPPAPVDLCSIALPCAGGCSRPTSELPSDAGSGATALTDGAQGSPGGRARP